MQTLENHGFLIKRIISNILWYHQEKGLLSDPDTSTDGLFTAEEVEETTLHHTFNSKHDTLRLNLTLNVYPKSRGMSTGPDLDQTDVEKVPITKTVLARLCGQCYQISGAFLDPVLIGFKIFISKSCRLVVGWNDVITFREFLQVIKESYKSLKEWPRMLIPESFWMKRIVCHTDGSLTACSFVFFLVSESHISAFCINIDAESRIKDHSVPCNETFGLVRVVMNGATFNINHFDDLASRIKGKLQVSFQIDSSCLGSWLNPSSSIKKFHQELLKQNI